MGTVMAGIARVGAHARGARCAPPAVLLSGGETTVTIGAGAVGRGGRNTEFLLGAGAGARRARRASGRSPATPTASTARRTRPARSSAPDTLARARRAGLDARAMLAGHDSYSVFRALGDLVTTGPTLTNVNDFRAILMA